MNFKKFNWIRTRDGSPTLWHNGEGAAFRSQKGAFTESLCAFVRPALESWREKSPLELRVVEFGLGPGTNWALWHLSSLALSKAGTPLKSSYTAIEKDPESFDLGYAVWLENLPLLASFVSAEWDSEITDREARLTLEEARKKIRIVSSLEELVAKPLHSAPADLWFHDPFGFDINPSAYQTEQLTKIHGLMAPTGRAYSYACNSPFQKALRASGFDVATPETGNMGLKRERLEFWPSLG